jgi:hypothetical protein
MKKHRGRPQKKKKTEAKKKEQQTRGRRKQDSLRWGGGQENLVIKDKKVFYGIKNRRGWPPKSKNVGNQRIKSRYGF